MTNSIEQPYISDFFNRYGEFAREKNVEGMAKLYDEDVTVFDLWNTPRIQGLSEWKRSIGEWFSSLGDNYDRVEFSEIEIAQDGDLAVAHALVRYAAVSESGEELRHMRNRITLTFRRASGNWKVTHQHTSAPITGKDLVVQLDF